MRGGADGIGEEKMHGQLMWKEGRAEGREGEMGVIMGCILWERWRVCGWVRGEVGVDPLPHLTGHKDGYNTEKHD